MLFAGGNRTGYNECTSDAWAADFRIDSDGVDRAARRDRRFELEGRRWWTTDSREMLRPWKEQDLSSSYPAPDAIHSDVVMR